VESTDCHASFMVLNLRLYLEHGGRASARTVIQGLLLKSPSLEMHQTRLMHAKLRRAQINKHFQPPHHP
jgi:hypothetical protein